MEQLSRNYSELVSLFEEFREFIKPEVVDGVPLFRNEGRAANTRLTPVYLLGNQVVIPLLRCNSLNPVVKFDILT